MKHYTLLFLLLSLTFCAAGQQYDRSKFCGTDTIDVSYTSKVNFEATRYKAFACTKVSKIGIRAEVGFAAYRYNERTKNWLGNHNGPLLGLALAYENFNIGFRFKPWTVRPKAALSFNGVDLPGDAKLNPVKLDYYFSYSINFKHNLSVEPYIGYTRTVFHVVNEQELGRPYDIPAAHGLITGIACNKYFRIKEFQFVGLFANCGYSFTDFKQTNNELGTGYMDFAVGIAYKGFFRRNFLERIR
jgi:hypothetical protein